MGPLEHAFVYLVAAVVAVPLAKRLGLGSVLGYLIAGTIIGPALGLVGGETEAVQHFAEFGVVMMLFLVGLELQPSMLWRMRGRLLGLGGMQVLATLLVGFAIAIACGVAWRASLTLGMILALSSTAIVLQTLGERGWLRAPAGRSSFAVLLFQDIAVIPMIAMMPLLASGAAATVATAPSKDHGHDGSALDGLPAWGHTAVILGVVAAIVVGGRFLLRPALRIVAGAGLREIFTAAALLIVIGVALLMTAIGLSPALGTFMAGVVLSDSEYRHELESDIEPFKGLLLGLFFISVGAGVDIGRLSEEPGLILGLAAVVMLAKAAVLMAVATVAHLPRPDRWLLTLGLCQAGEFAFVLFAQAQGGGVLDAELAQRMVLVVAVTMLLTPLGFLVFEHVVMPRTNAKHEQPADPVEERGTVLIAGVGRFGTVITRLLSSNGMSVVLLDHNARWVDVLRQLDIRAHYGDATRPDLLHAAGIDEARLFVAALDDREKQTALVAYVAKHHPGCRILARAIDRHHVYELETAGAHRIERETFESALSLGRHALVDLGVHPFKAQRQARNFRCHDRASFDALREVWHAEGMSKRYLDAARTRVQAMSAVMASDRAADRHDPSERGWVPPPAGDAQLEPEGTDKQTP